MSLSLRCKVSLSKKLRAIVGENATVILMADSLEGGKGEGQLSITSSSMDEYDTLPAELNSETSISITPISITDDMPRDAGVSTIFSSVPDNPSSEPVISKIAAVKAPEAGEESRAVQGEPETPIQFAEVDEPECKNYITNLGELLDAVGELEEMERAGMIGKAAYIVNRNYAIITVNDLDIDLPQNMPFNLGNLPAQKVAESVHLRQLLKGKLIEFVSPQEASDILEGIDSQDSAVTELEVFDSPAQAEAAIGNKKTAVIDDESALEVSADDLDGPTEEESIINLTGVGSSPIPSGDKGVRVSSHGARTSSRTTETSGDKKPALSTIRRLG